MRILPDSSIGTARLAPIGDMSATRIQIRKLRDKPRCEIFVEEQHVPPSRPGYSPLYTRARRQTPDMLDVLARQLQKIGENLLLGHAGREVGGTSPTVIRVPRTDGFPKRISGSMTMRSR